jgi:hypothetical protein
MRTIEDPADPMRQLLVSREQPVGLDHLALGVDPLGLYGVQPRAALLGHKAAYDPHSSFAATLFDSAVVRGYPLSDLFGGVPALARCPRSKPPPPPLACSFELLAAPRKKAGGYPAHGPPIHEARSPTPSRTPAGRARSSRRRRWPSDLKVVFSKKDCSTRRMGSAASLQLLRAGRASRLHLLSRPRNLRPNRGGLRPGGSIVL